MLKIAVLDDEQIFYESIKKKIYSFYEKLHLVVSVDCYSSGKALMYEVDDGKYYDIYLLDIDLPDMSGIDLGRILREKSPYCYIVFLTAYADKNRFYNNIDKIDAIVNVFDAVGIGLFAVSSVQRCIQYGYGDNAFLCIMMSMTTCIGGSIMRDLLCQKLPAVLRKRIYALATIAGGALYYYMFKFGIGREISMVAGVGITIAIRLLATKYKWNMPRIEK